jgi:hypothetical protein
MENKIKDFVIASQVFDRAAEAAFFLKVALQVARSSPSMSYWLMVAKSKTKVSIPQITYGVPDRIGADNVFLLAARTALGQQEREAMNRDRLDAILDKLHGDAELHDADNDGVHLLGPIYLSLCHCLHGGYYNLIFPTATKCFLMSKIGCS